MTNRKNFEIFSLWARARVASSMPLVLEDTADTTKPRPKKKPWLYDC